MRMRIAIIESPNPIDVFESRTEAKALEATCKLLGHKPASFFPRSRSELRTVCKFLASADSAHTSRRDNAPLFIHISCHGNDGGLGFGADFIRWDELAEDLMPIFKNEDYRGQTVLCLSACGSGEHEVHVTLKEKLEDNLARPPAYIVSIRGETVQWDDALVAWTLFYHKMAKVDFSDFNAVKAIFDDIYDCIQVQFSYHRYHEATRRFRVYPARLHSNADANNS